MNISKTWLWILITVVVLALAWAGWRYGFFSPLTIKEEAPLSGNDATSDIEKDLNSVDFGNVDQDFKSVDTDLNSL